MKKAQIANIILGIMFAMIALIIFIAGFPVWKAVINDFVAGNSDIGVSLIVKSFGFFTFVMFVILFISILTEMGG